MRATIMYSAGDVRVENVPDPTLQQPTDALVRIVRACVCGSDLHPYHDMPATPGGTPMGHEFVGVVEEVGGDVATLKKGDFVIAPFAWSDGTCEFCREGLQTSCRHGGFWAGNGIGGAQAEAIRVPFADGTLVKAPVGEDSELLPSTAHPVRRPGYRLPRCRQGSGRTNAASSPSSATAQSASWRFSPPNDLAPSGSSSWAATKSRTDLGIEFGATDIVAERGDEGIAKVRELTGGDGTDVVLEAVGHMPAYEQAIGVVRPGGVISRVGVPQYEVAPSVSAACSAPTSHSPVARLPSRAYIEELMPDVLDGKIQPGKVFDRTVNLDEVPDAYRAMDTREALKVLVRP